MSINVILQEMLVMQDQLNTRTIGEDWKNAGKDWKLAAMMEAAEAIDHLGWKWWAHQQPSEQRARVEVIDILHFALSDMLRYHVGYKSEPLATEIAFQYAARKNLIDLPYSELRNGPNPRSVLRLIAATAAKGEDLPLNVGTVIYAGELLGMSFLQQSILYRQKVILNCFRQDNGYKEGRYIKVWDGREDNDWMQQFSEYIDWTRSDASTLLCSLLRGEYLRITA